MCINEPMTQERLDAIQKREAKAGPWDVEGSAYCDPLDTITAHEDVLALLAEVERLRARPTVDGGMVERAAGTLFKQDFLERNPEADDAQAQHRLEQVRAYTPKAWGQYLQGIRAALDAALGTGEGS